MTKTDLFIELAKPDVNGFSRWVNVSEFVGKYAELKFGNGASWARKESLLSKNYIVEFDKKNTSGNGIDRIRLNGKQNINLHQHIRSDIKKIISSQRCLLLGTSNVEVDHKNGRKMNQGGDPAVLNVNTQKLSDFQPLSKAANDAKRQHCKNCSSSNQRFDAKQLGYSISFYSGNHIHNGTKNGCIGCFWYDPIQFRKFLK